MIITKRHLDRRTVLRGMGVTLALPLLDCMVPALASGKTAPKPVPRLGIVYVPNGIRMSRWTPAVDGAAFEFTPILEPLTPFRDRLLVLSGLQNPAAFPVAGEVAGHALVCGAFLTGVHVKKAETNVRAGISMDQIAAKELGQHTQLPSLELSLDSRELLGNCSIGYSCSYSTTICWSSSTTPLPMETNPRAVFDRLFGGGDSTDLASRLARLRKRRSILDFLAQDHSQLLRGLGPRDGTKVTEYLEAVRDVERRIQKSEEQSAHELPEVERPEGVPSTFAEYAKLMFDLQVLAYQSDLTRVISFMIGREQSARAYPEIGVPEGHHELSHADTQSDKADPGKAAMQVKVNTYHVKLFADYLEKLRTTPDGDGSLLDHLTIVYAGGMGNGNQHMPVDLPILVVGGAAGQIKGGRHLRFKDTPVTNLHLTVLDKLGLPMERFGENSTGKMEQLSTV